MAEVTPLVKYLNELCERIEKDDNYVDQARDASDAIIELQRAEHRLAAIKTAGIRALFEQGWTVKDIGEEVGVSRARIHQIITR